MRAVVGLLVEAVGLDAPIGAFVEIECGDPGVGEEARLPAEVVGLRGDVTLLMPLGEVRGLRVGARLRATARSACMPSGPGCLGRVLDALGRPIDGGPALRDVGRRSVDAKPIDTVERARIERPLDLGLRAMNAFATVGLGMRLGIFAGSGVGKSTLLGQLAAQAEVDVAVIALIGERRREVREFIERDLGEALERSVVVVSTSDEPAPMRTRAARAATAIAEDFRDRRPAGSAPDGLADAPSAPLSERSVSPPASRRRHAATRRRCGVSLPRLARAGGDEPGPR